MSANDLSSWGTLNMAPGLLVNENGQPVNALLSAQFGTLGDVDQTTITSTAARVEDQKKAKEDERHDSVVSLSGEASTIDQRRVDRDWQSARRKSHTLFSRPASASKSGSTTSAGASASSAQHAPEATAAQPTNGPAQVKDEGSPTVNDLLIIIWRCGHVHVEFDKSSAVYPFWQNHAMCGRLACQIQPQFTSFDQQEQSLNEALQLAELYALRAEVGAMNAVIGQGLYRLEYHMTGRLQPSELFTTFTHRLVERDMKLPVISELLKRAVDTLFLWDQMVYLKAATILLERAKFHFAGFVNFVDERCGENEGYLKPGRFSEQEIEDLGRIVPGYDDDDTEDEG